MKPIHVGPEADADLDGLTEYYAAVAGTELALRFLDSVESTFSQISRYPNSGALVRPDTGRFTGIRFALLHGFPRIVVFYRNGERHVDVIRVVHGSRDLEEALKG